MEYTDVKTLYLAHGRAGHECMQKLLFELQVRPSNIYTLTYDREENRELLELCRKEGVEYSTGSIRDEKTRDALVAYGSDVVVSIHFRELIPAVIFKSATLGGFNLHPSLLPKFRGCFSGVWAIIKGEETTGVSYHYLNEQFDDGKIILQKKLTIGREDTGHTLFNRLIDLGVSCFNEAFELVVKDSIEGHEQVGEPSYFGRNLPYEGLINPEWSENEIDRFVRALDFSGLEGARVETEKGQIAVRTMDEYRELMVRK